MKQSLKTERLAEKVSSGSMRWIAAAEGKLNVHKTGYLRKTKTKAERECVRV